MEIKVNDESYQFNEAINIQQVLNDLNISEKGIAVALNQSIIQKSHWAQTTVQHQDNLLIIKATQGG